MGLCGWVGAHARAWAATSSIGEAMGSNEATTAASPAITAHGPVPSASGCTHPLPDCLIVFILDCKLQFDLQSLLTHRLFHMNLFRMNPTEKAARQMKPHHHLVGGSLAG